jgi:hypothetical protein
MRTPSRRQDFAVSGPPRPLDLGPSKTFVAFGVPLVVIVVAIGFERGLANVIADAIPDRSTGRLALVTVLARIGTYVSLSSSTPAATLRRDGHASG